MNPMTETFNIEELTRDQPFCAGVILLFDKHIVVNLNNDVDANNNILRIGAVGGGQNDSKIDKEE
jgi:hypothetical protein